MGYPRKPSLSNNCPVSLPQFLRVPKRFIAPSVPCIFYQLPISGRLTRWRSGVRAFPQSRTVVREWVWCRFRASWTSWSGRAEPCHPATIPQPLEVDSMGSPESVPVQPAATPNTHTKTPLRKSFLRSFSRWLVIGVVLREAADLWATRGRTTLDPERVVAAFLQVLARPGFEAVVGARLELAAAVLCGREGCSRLLLLKLSSQSARAFRWPAQMRL
jgi:hypothetical protein